ncbi:hypothetical protein L596_030622 [Steinernema carpocapsae]|uniref:Uncharacterized protein n=1 Tax=Steinernema carpocapsae TaxID=34508 RepID=A0A4U5LPW9_STECR|nr:hypothetical protein L596_030622 [Steinernema carpocapsae]
MKLFGLSTLIFALLLSSALTIPAGQIQELPTTEGSGNDFAGPLLSSLNSNDIKVHRVKRHYDGRCYMCRRWDDGECDCNYVYHLPE